MRGKGLTLIEVLVVIVVISALAAIAIPVLKKSKDQGKDLLCTNNLRQLEYAINIYTQNHPNYPEGFCGDGDDCHPSVTFQQSVALGINNVYDYSGYWWFCFLAETIDEDPVDKNSVFWCPLRNVQASTLKSNFLGGNYGINHSICKIIETKGDPGDEFTGIPYRPERVISPTTKLLLVDSGYALVSWKALAPDVALYPFENSGRQNSYYLPGAEANQDRFDNGTINDVQVEDAVKGRHSGGKFNAAFADGHVDRMKPSSVEADFDATGNVLSSSHWSP